MTEPMGDWPQHEHGDPDGLPSEGDGQSEREAAVTAAQRLLAGPSLVVPRAVLFELTTLLRQAIVLLEQALNEAGVPPACADDNPSTE
jgi:hypothetical protein